jgi:hypothetical protein
MESTERWLTAADEIERVQPEVKLGDRVEFVKSRPGLADLNGYKGVITGEGAFSLHVTLDGETDYRVAWKDELKVLPVEEAQAPVVKKVQPKLSVAKARLYPSAKIILKHLKARQTISPMEALASYGCMRLAARIHDLREAGCRISTEMHTDHAGHPYARYSLIAA